MVLWLTVLILSIVVEIITIDLVSIWITAGSIFALIAYALHFNLFIQITVCILVSLICFLFVRPITKKTMSGTIIHTNADRLIGKKGIVTKEIQKDTKGEVKVLGNFWSAITIDNQAIPVGKHVTILSIDGVKLIVREEKES